MSVLEFFSSLKWPIVLLAVFFWIARALKRNPGFADWLKRWLEHRDVRGKIGFTEFEALMPSKDIVQAAAATDEELAALAGRQDPVSSEGPADDTANALTALRREVVEEVIRMSAQWGWDTAKMGFRTSPDPQVIWTEDGRPEIQFGVGASVPISRTFVVGETGALTAAELNRRADLQGAIRRRLEENERVRQEGA